MARSGLPPRDTTAAISVIGGGRQRHRYTVWHSSFIPEKMTPKMRPGAHQA
ncbi:MAG: hypothetical protein ACXWV0_00095 [Flavisolibacter sp.]